MVPPINWSQETIIMTCHSSNSFSFVSGQGNASCFSFEQLLRDLFHHLETNKRINKPDWCLDAEVNAPLSRKLNVVVIW